MSVSHISAAFRHSKAKLAARFVLVCLANFADEDGRCYPSVTTIARHCGMSERAVHTALETLLRLGEVELLKKGGTINKKTISNLYRVTVPMDGCTTRTGAGGAPGKPGAGNAPVQKKRLPGAGAAPDPVQEVQGIRKVDTKRNDNDVGGVSSLSVSLEEGQEASTLAKEFGGHRKQARALEKRIRDQGLGYVQEKAEIARERPPEHRNGAFWTALEEDWARPAAPEPAKAKPAPLQEPAGWRDWAKRRYPLSDLSLSWREVCNLLPDIRAEFEADRAKAQNPVATQS